MLHCLPRHMNKAPNGIPETCGAQMLLIGTERPLLHSSSRVGIYRGHLRHKLERCCTGQQRIQGLSVHGSGVGQAHTSCGWSTKQWSITEAVIFDFFLRNFRGWSWIFQATPGYLWKRHRWADIYAEQYYSVHGRMMPSILDYVTWGFSLCFEWYRRPQNEQKIRPAHLGGWRGRATSPRPDIAGFTKLRSLLVELHINKGLRSHS